MRSIEPAVFAVPGAGAGVNGSLLMKFLYRFSVKVKAFALGVGGVRTA
jgi:hypothetical protein